MIQAFQFDNLPVALVLWLILYSADYFLTLHGNQLRATYAKSHVGMDGSYELNPYYQRDIDSNKRVSQRFIFMLVLFASWLALMWYGARLVKIPEIFSVAAGYVLLLEVPVLSTHLQNISQFNFMKTPGAVVGHITYARWIQVTLAARAFGYWLVVYSALFLLTGNWFFVGGAASMLGLFIRYSSRGQRLREKSPTVTALKNSVPQPASSSPNSGDGTVGEVN